MRRIIYLSLGVLTAALLPLGLRITRARASSVPNLKGTCIWQEFKYPTTISDQQQSRASQLSWHLSTLMGVAH